MLSMSNEHTLYAITHSLYSGRARAYLIKQGIPFRELSTGHESFKAEVLPKGKLPTIPTLVTPEGQVIRDGAAIIEHFESANGRPCLPAGPKQSVVSALFDLVGAQGLLRPAMHYRWNFPGDNLTFVCYHFYHSQRDLPAREEKTEHMMGRMRHAAQMFGVTDDTRSLVESLYLDLLDALNQHFEQVPYLLGWRPCIGDFGLLAPMYAHLGRDPHPLRIMQQRATRVHRWVERMNRADQDVPEYFDAGDDFLDADEVPQSLQNVMAILAEDLVPETIAAAEVIGQWLADNDPRPGLAAERALGSCQFDVRGQRFTAMVQPYRFFQLRKMHELFDSMNTEDQAQVRSLFSSCSLEPLLDLRLPREVVFEDNLEVWR